MKDLLSKFFETIDNAIAKINGLLPTLTPAEARQLIADIEALQNGLSDAIKALQAVRPSLQRIVDGSTRHDKANEVEMSKAWGRLDAIRRGEDAYTQMVKNAQAEKQQERERLAAEAKAAKAAQQRQFEYIERVTHGLGG